MNNFDFDEWVHGIVVTTESWFTDLWSSWESISPDKRMAYSFALLSLIAIAFVLLYRAALTRAELAIRKLSRDKMVSDVSKLYPEVLPVKAPAPVNDELFIDGTWVQDMLKGMREEHREALETIVAVTTNSNKTLADTHAETMAAVHKLVQCVENVYVDSDQRVDDNR